jgi:predicted dehydrogenase
MRRYVGVIGLGRRWQRYQPALAALHPRLEVRAVCDQVPALAEQTARQIGCAAAAGPLDLLERDDVQAVLLLDRQWYGLWPLELAARLGKPVFCAPSLHTDEAHLPALRESVRSAGLPVLPGNALAVHPLLGRLRELLGDLLGAPRVLRGEQIIPCRRRHLTRRPGPRLLPRLLPWMQLCGELLEGEPRHFTVTMPPRSGLICATLEFPGGQTAQLNLLFQPRTRPTARLRVLAADGRASVSWPRMLRWHEDGGVHVLRQPGVPTPQLLLAAFLRMLDEGVPDPSPFEQACRAVGWLQALRVRMTWPSSSPGCGR